MKRFVVCLVALCLALPLFAGGGQEATTVDAASAPARLAFWAIGGRSQADIINDMVVDFQKEYPNIDVEVTMNGEWEEHFQKILVAAAGGSPPDLIRSKDFWVAEFASRGAIEDLSPWIAKEKDISIDPAKFVPVRWNQSLYQGKMYSLPWTTFTELFFYNKKIFRDAGLNRGPDNWAEIRDFAKKTTDVGNKQWGSILYTYTRVSPAMTEFWELLLMQNGGSVMNKDETAFTINTPGGVQALQHQLDMIYKDKSMLSPEFASLTQPVERGQIAMWYSGPWQFTGLPKDFPDLEFQPILMPGLKSRSVYAVGNNLIMFKDGKAKAATWELLKFMFQEKNDHRWNSEGGYLPSRIENLQLEPYKSDPNWKVQVDQFQRDDTESRPYPLGFTEIHSGIAAWLQKAYLGNVGAAEALKNAQDEANVLLKKLNS